MRFDALVTGAVERLGPIDVLVGNAAANPYFGPLRDIEDRAWDKVMGTNVRSNLWLCNRVIPGMAERGGGAVILVSSIAAFKGDAALGAYSVSKAAQIQLVRSLAVEWGPAGVRVNAIAPGLVRTDFARALWEDDARRAGARTGHSASPDRRAGGCRRRCGVPRFARRCLCHGPVHRRRRRRDDCRPGWIDRAGDDRRRGVLARNRTGCTRKDPTAILAGQPSRRKLRGRVTCR